MAKKIKIDIVLPVYYGNLHEVEDSVKKQVKYYKKALKDFDWKIVLAINGLRAEKVIALAKKLAKRYKRFRYVHTKIPGKGSGIIYAWMHSNADILSYMDIDLATDLACFRDLIEQLNRGYDISIGSRYHPESKTKRTLKRFIFSMIYHIIFTRLILGMKYSDMQCGFKAIKREVAKKILPLIKNKKWFFETEILYIADKKGYKIKEIPIIWKESKFSGINIYKAGLEFLKSTLELRFRKI